ncbi:MAG TPA: GNAT family N-acetyltransferase [Candidatus Eremiobacteraceae bacterium]|nr:GNAT family N-acetyltransferase [Candidatus Eremiobacteraceae bacterium]
MTASFLRVRDGVAEDRPFMLALDGLVLGTPRSTAWYDEQLRAGHALVAERDGVLAGFAIHHRHFFQRDFLALLIVEPWCRRSGVATALLRAVEKRCAGADLFTSTNASNQTMRQALKRWGFRATGRIDNIDPGDPELVFVKPIRRT